MSEPTDLRPTPEPTRLLYAANAAPQRALVYKETVSNTVVTAVVAVLLTWVIFRGQSSIAVLVSPPRGIFGVIPGTFNFTLLVSIVLTLVTRRRMRRGAVPRLSGDGAQSRTQVLPRNVLVRGIVLALVMSIIFIPATYAVVWMLVTQSVVPVRWPLWGLLLLFTVHFTMLALVVTPLVVWRALHD